jgi:PIN domain nuclease of toxin-antitoxin system
VGVRVQCTLGCYTEGRGIVAAMIVDSSALLALLRAEPDAAVYALALAAAERVRLSAANSVETAAVIG